MDFYQIDVKKLRKAISLTMAYLVNQKILQKKQSEVENLCKQNIKKLSKEHLKKNMNSEQREIAEALIQKKFLDYKIELSRQRGIYELLDELKMLEKKVMVKNDNPLHDNNPPTYVTILRNYCETMAAKYGFSAFSFSGEAPDGGISVFDYWVSKFETADGKKVFDATIVAKVNDDKICAYKVLMPKDLKRFCCDNYTFANEQEIQEFIKKNHLLVHHSRHNLEKNNLVYYKNTIFEYSPLSRLVYPDINDDYVEIFNKQYIESVLKTFEYKNILLQKKFGETNEL